MIKLKKISLAAVNRERQGAGKPRLYKRGGRFVSEGKFLGYIPEEGFSALYIDGAGNLYTWPRGLDPQSLNISISI